MTSSENRSILEQKVREKKEKEELKENEIEVKRKEKDELKAKQRREREAKQKEKEQVCGHEKLLCIQKTVSTNPCICCDHPQMSGFVTGLCLIDISNQVFSVGMASIQGLATFKGVPGSF